MLILEIAAGVAIGTVVAAIIIEILRENVG